LKKSSASEDTSHCNGDPFTAHAINIIFFLAYR